MAQDSVVDPDIHQNFYQPGSLLIELQHLSGLNKKEQTIVAEIKSLEMEVIQTIEYAFDNRDTVAQHLTPECIKDHEEVSVYIYVKNSSDGDKSIRWCQIHRMATNPCDGYKSILL